MCVCIPTLQFITNKDGNAHRFAISWELLEREKEKEEERAKERKRAKESEREREQQIINITKIDTYLFVK